jgi:hypothetical protein
MWTFPAAVPRRSWFRREWWVREIMGLGEIGCVSVEVKSAAESMCRFPLESPARSVVLPAEKMREVSGWWEVGKEVRVARGVLSLRVSQTRGC